MAERKNHTRLLGLVVFIVGAILGVIAEKIGSSPLRCIGGFCIGCGIAAMLIGG